MSHQEGVAQARYQSCHREVERPACPTKPYTHTRTISRQPRQARTTQAPPNTSARTTRATFNR